jgi:hypothetical protein
MRRTLVPAAVKRTRPPAVAAVTRGPSGACCCAKVAVQERSAMKRQWLRLRLVNIKGILLSGRLTRIVRGCGRAGVGEGDFGTVFGLLAGRESLKETRR